ncbi:cytidylyltransferase family-domain-containing protein [Chytridium lagenaria]|nr:cytidylyltransferase family-domain-containing protein [Chytridium lagenaria]
MRRRADDVPSSTVDTSASSRSNAPADFDTSGDELGATSRARSPRGENGSLRSRNNGLRHQTSGNMGGRRLMQQVEGGHTDGNDFSSSAYDTDYRKTDGDGNGQNSSAPVTMLVEEPFMKKWRNWWVRSFWTFVMEVISIAHIPSKEKKMPWFRTMNWYFLLTIIFVDALGVYLATHHQFISFILYVFGFVAFVMNLQKGHYKFQFSQFAWTHMTLLLVVVQSQFIVKNIFEGLVWFILPTSLVICNDISAYIAGFFFGRTPLIRLSPKKTWEGFIGALIACVIFAFFFSGFIVDYPYFTCPVRNMKTSSFSGVTCTLNPVFVKVDYNLAPPLVSLLWHITGMEFRSVHLAPFQFHAIIMALFASLIAPFGGFFASGAKRAFKLKDFGDSIPGHGGITDRMGI